MMDLSKTLRDDIRINQINLRAAIQNHQALVVKLEGGNLSDSSEVKLKLAGIQNHILSLGKAQKFLIARAKKEFEALNKRPNHTSDRSDRPQAELRVYPPSANCLDASKKSNSTHQKRPFKEVKADGDADAEDSDRKRIRVGCDEDGGGDGEVEGEGDSPPGKRHKTILHGSRPAVSPPPLLNTPTPRAKREQIAVASSSEDSQESLTIESPSEPSKVDFLSAVGLVTREQMMLSKGNSMARRRRRHAGHHSQYSSHWDLTVRRHRPKMEQDKDQEVMAKGEEVTSVPASALESVDAKKEEKEDSSSGSPSPPPTHPLDPGRDLSSSPDKITCTLCRKRGILSVCDICSTAFHWFCLDKSKKCPQCQVSQTGDTPSPFHNQNGTDSDSTLSRVMGGGGAGANYVKPMHVSSTEVIARYYKRPPDNATYAERLRVKKNLEARNETLKNELASLEKKATDLSAALVSQTENIKKLTAGEEKTKEKIKKILDVIDFFKTVPS